MPNGFDPNRYGSEVGTPYVNSRGEIVHKHTPTIGVILLTAITFLIVGALTMGGVMLCLHLSGNLNYSAGLPTDGTTQTQTADTTGTPVPTQSAAAATPTPVVTPTPEVSPSEDRPNGTLMGLPDLIDSVIDGTVVVHSYDSSRPTEFSLIGTGTGFFISDDGYVITNAHVVEDAVSVQVQFRDGVSVTVDIVGTNTINDVAVLKMAPDAHDFVALEVGDSDSVRVGDFVVVIGHPTGDELSFSSTFGMVGAIDRRVNIDGVSNYYIQIDAAINPGNSGGPLFNLNGQVIGVNSAKTVTASYDEYGNAISAEGLGFALPINTVMEIASSIIDTGSSPSPGLGLSVYEVSPDRAELYSVPVGLLVYYVVEDAPACLAGLRADDIIISVDGINVATHAELSASFADKSVGDVITISYWRSGTTHTCELTLGDRNLMGDTVYKNQYGGSIIGLNP